MLAYLALENGKVFEGRSIGATGECIGEVVFNTNMTGYQEIITDPTNYGQIVTMTYPLIGNYGINDEEFLSPKPQIKGLIVREQCLNPNNYKSKGTLSDFLKKNNIVGIEDIDTRALTKTLRENGTMNGIISTDPNFKIQEKIELIKKYRLLNPVAELTSDAPVHHCGNGFHIALLNFGSKNSILSSLLKRDFAVTVFPWNTTAQDILNSKPHCIVLSDGPGNPKDCSEIMDNLIKLMNSGIPILGVSLGHQLIALAAGMETVKLKYGHRGSNQPVKDTELNKSFITTQNHGYMVLAESVDPKVAKITHINMNDNTVEGLRYTNKNIFTVQFHPESISGPSESGYLFDCFFEMLK